MLFLTTAIILMAQTMMSALESTMMRISIFCPCAGDIVFPHKDLKRMGAKKQMASRLNKGDLFAPAAEVNSKESSKVQWVTPALDLHRVFLQDLLTRLPCP